MTGLPHVNNGWHLSDEPLNWEMRHEIRDGSAHLVCPVESQSVFCLAPDVDRLGFTFSLAVLKARVADHVLRCHADQIADLTYR